MSGTAVYLCSKQTVTVISYVNAAMFEIMCRMAVSGGLADALSVEVLYCQLQVLTAFLNTCCSSC